MAAIDKPLILICNDDGITAPGLRALTEVALEFGEVKVVAPDSPQSGMGHAITIGEPLRIYKEKLIDGVEAWSCSGTPVDCVKLATGVILDRKPDLLLSGINHGGNYSISVVYSGTMSAAMEGSIEGICSMGFSLLDHSRSADFAPTQAVAREIIAAHFRQPMAKAGLLNINIPKLPLSELKGIKIARQSRGRWVEKFDERLDPHGQRYFWLSGKFADEDHGEDTDYWAINNGYVSVCPVQFDLTAHHRIPDINQWDLALPSTTI